VRLWSCEYDPKAGVPRHTVLRGFGHALLAPLIGNVFEALRVSASVWEHGAAWFAIHTEPNVGAFELEHGLENERGRYNSRCFRSAAEQRRPVRGDHAGFADYFVPIIAQGQVAAILVTGPFATARPTGPAVLERWRWLTKRQGHPADPEFASYLAATLSTLVLDGDRAAVFARLLACIAQLCSGQGDAEALVNEATVLRAALESARSAERVWDAVRTMVDDRSPRTWQSAFRAFALASLGLGRIPDHVLVAFAATRLAPDPVDHAIRIDAFQRRAVELARATGGVIAGQVGEHGAVFLCAGSGSADQRRRQLLHLADRASGLAQREFGIALHFGASGASESAPLSRSYHAALGAAQSALSKGARMVTAEPGEPHVTVSLWRLRQELGLLLDERPSLLATRFDRYLESVALHCGYRMDRARAELEIGFARMADTLVARGGLDEKSLGSMRDGLERAASAARTLTELFAQYRLAVADVSHALEHPGPARQDRNLRRATDYIAQHYAEPLRLETVASVAGFTPTYFSRLFRKREGVPFGRYVAAIRIERAKQLLASTDLDASRIAELSGFATPQYFSAQFRRWAGVTPLTWRRDQRARTARKRNPKHTEV
jgi:AraC-like DNA-binding protein